MTKLMKLDAKERWDRTEAVFDTIEGAIEFEGNLEDELALPEGLRDPISVMARVRALLDAPICLPGKEAAVVADAAVEVEEYRAAARNGGQIPNPVLVQMHRDRLLAEGTAEDVDGPLQRN